MHGVSRPFSASAGATVLVTALVVVPYVLSRLRKFVPEARATTDWRSPLDCAGQLLLFEAFVTNQRTSRMLILLSPHSWPVCRIPQRQCGDRASVPQPARRGDAAHRLGD